MRYSRICRDPLKTILTACTAGVFLLLAAPQPGLAFDLFGIHLWGKKKTDGNDDIIGEAKYYTVKVVAAAGAPDEGIKIARASSVLVAQQDKPVSGSAGLLARARGDYRRILAALYAQGRYGGIISISIDGREAGDIPAWTELPDHVAIIIAVDCGPHYRFGLATVHELAPVPANRKKKTVLPQDIGYKTGDIATSEKILQSEQLALDGWKRQGYARADVAHLDVVADHATRTIDADIRIKQGLLAHFGNLSIRNVSTHPRMDPAYIAWMTGIKPGQIYDPEVIAKANKRLSRLEVFRAASIHEADVIEPDGSLPLSLTVQERLPRRFGAGAAYSTLDGAGIEGYWMHRNLFGHAEQLRVDGRISNIGGSRNKSYAPQNYSYLLGMTYLQPGVYTPDTDYVATLKGEREVLEHYTSTGLYFSNGFRHVFSDALSGYIYFNAARVETKDDYFGNRTFTTAGFLGGLLYDARDNQVDPHSGFYGELVAQPFYEAEYGNFLGKITMEGRTYLSLDKHDRFVIAMRAKVGSIMGAQATELPSNMLFFAGGGGSVRGYTYRNIGVRTNTGDVIGGRSLVEGSAELRTMLTQNIGVVGFADAGVVGEDVYPDFRENTKVGVGLGVRYKTGMGPLRFDVAMPLNRAKGDPSIGFYIGIGQAF